MKFLYLSVTVLLLIACKPEAQRIVTTAHEIPWASNYKNIVPGAILVPENHDNPSGNKIKLTYVVSHAKDTTSKQYPLIYFSGGPGGVSIYESMMKIIHDHPLNRDRDIIFFDQRGIGFSNGLPDMAFPAFDILAANATEEEELQLSIDLMDEYKKKCEQLGIQLQYYNTNQSSHDVGMLMEHLGYEKYNLMGGSYGTRLARVIQSAFPDKIHCAVHNSPSPMTGDFLIGRLESYSKALLSVLENCRQDSACVNSYPNLDKKYLDGIEALRTAPMEIPMGDSAVFYLNAQDGVYLLRRLLYQTDALERSPEFIEALYDRNPEPIKEVVDIEYEMTDGLNLTMLMAVEKFEQFDPANTDEKIEEYYDSFQMIPARVGFFDAFYRGGMNWHEGHLPLEDRGFAPSDIPTIIFVNKYDPVTPPKYGYLYMENLTNGQLFVLDEGGHGGGNADCRQNVVSDFMANPTKKLDISCLNLVDYK